MTIKTIRTVAQTTKLGQWLGQQLPIGCVVALNGNLGAGKTTFVKAIMQGMSSEDSVHSPAFTLVAEYQAKRKKQTFSVYHMDFYRLETLSDMDYLLFAEYMDDDTATKLIEWADKFIEQFANDYLSIEIKATSLNDEEQRQFTFQVVGDNAELKQLLKGLETYRV